MEVTSVNTNSLYDQVTKSTKDLGKEAFLRMLVTQMRFQDPLNPVSDTQFISQLAEFSSLEQLQNLNSNFESNMLLSQSLHNSMAVNMIGREVKIYGSFINLKENATADIQFDLQKDAGVVLKITNEAGKLVREMNLGQKSAGPVEAVWDGKDNNGDKVNPGTYKYQVEAKDESGASVPIVAYTVGTVTGIKYDEGIAILMLGNNEVRLGEVIEVMNPE